MVNNKHKCHTFLTKKHAFAILFGTVLASSARFYLPMAHAAQNQSSAVIADSHAFHVKDGEMATTLREIARISGVTIEFNPGEVAPLLAPGIEGTLSTQEAVQRAIEGSGLTLSSAGNNLIHVGFDSATVADGDVGVATGSIVSPEVPSQELQAPDSATRLGAVTVIARRDQAETSFNTTKSDTATRLDADLMDTPQSISIMTAKVLETQQSQSVTDALQNIAGVVVKPVQPQGNSTGFNIRGMNGGTASNGLNNPNATNVNVAGVAQIEVLKGPQAILSGGENMSGTVNVVTKKPTAEPVRDISLEYGSNNGRKFTADFSGPFSAEDKRLTYRLIGSTSRSSHSDSGFYGNQDDYLLGQLRWKDETTDLTVGVSAENSHTPPPYYTVSANGHILSAPTRRIGNKDDGVGSKDRQVFYILDQKLTSSIDFRSSMNGYWNELDLDMWFPSSNVEGNVFKYMNSNNFTKTSSFSGDHYVRLKTELGPVSDTLSTGFNHSKTRVREDMYSLKSSYPQGAIYSDDAALVFPHLTRDMNSMTTKLDLRSQQYGVYAQNLVQWDKWSLSAGVRRNRYIEGGNHTDTVASGRIYPEYTPSFAVEKTTYNGGIVYNLTDNTSLYASYMEGFSINQPSAEICGATGVVMVPPSISKNYEAGIKGRVGGDFSWSGSIYEMKQSNVLRAVNSSCYQQVAGSTTDGIELEASGELFSGLNLLSNYTFADEKTAESDQPAYGQPKHQFSFWSTYDFQSEPMRDWQVSLGLTAWSSQKMMGDDSKPAGKAPGGTRVQAGLAYIQPDWSARLGIYNLFNQTLYPYAYTEGYVSLDKKRTATLTFTKKF